MYSREREGSGTTDGMGESSAINFGRTRFAKLGRSRRVLDRAFAILKYDTKTGALQWQSVELQLRGIYISPVLLP